MDHRLVGTSSFLVDEYGRLLPFVGVVGGESLPVGVACLARCWVLRDRLHGCRVVGFLVTLLVVVLPLWWCRCGGGLVF